MKKILQFVFIGCTVLPLASLVHGKSREEKLPILDLITDFSRNDSLKQKMIRIKAVDKDCDCPEKQPNGDPGTSPTRNALTSHSVKTKIVNAVNSEEVPKYLNPKLSIEARIDDLLPRLTLDEKIIQLSDSWGSKGIARLKIPPMLKTEGLHGQSYATGSTIFPHSIVMASTFDQALIGKVGQVTAVESKAAGLRSSWSPVLDVARDARWGRVEETYGEDPYLVSRMGVAWINGFQAENMIAVPKHFAGHGEPLGGRDSHDVGLSDRVMRNVHLVPFRAAIKEAHAGGVMSAYSTWNGVPDNSSKELLQKILREEWGFDGYVVSDCGGPENLLRKQSVVGNLEEAARDAILAGVDIECGSAYQKFLGPAVKNGYLKESDLDPNLRRVFRAKMKLGLFENPGSEKMVWDKLPAYDTPEHRALAHKVAVDGSVLLKNNKLLPLSKDIKTIAVIGPNADLAQTGDYSAKAAPGQLITVLQGIKSHVSPSTKVLYAKGCEVQSQDSTGFAAAVEIAKQSDAVVLVVGDNSSKNGAGTTGENIDGATLDFPGVQRQLIKALKATGKPIVLVLVNGKPFTLSWEDENIAAILETWYPGEEGGNATADLIFGDRNPSGRLPITFPRHVGQLPLHYNYLPTGRNYPYYDMPFTPLYRFGYGLSYTSFKYSNLKSGPKAGNPGVMVVSAEVENTGSMDGDEVAQLYVTDVISSVITPIIELKGIQRVSLKKGEKKTVQYELTPYDLSLLNADMLRVLEPGKFRIHVGGASPTPPDGNFEHKQKIGYKKAEDGVSGEFDVAKKYQADFTYELKVPAKVVGGNAFQATVTVKNQGNLVDVAEVKLYSDGLQDTYRWEIEPGETKSHVFNVLIYKGGLQAITAIVGKKILSKNVVISAAPAKLSLDNVRTNMDEDGKYHYTAMATNTGTVLYTGKPGISVNGIPVVNKTLELKPGESRELKMDYAFPSSGVFRVKAGSAAEQQLIVPGGISLALQNPLVYLDFEKAAGTGVVNEVTGTPLSTNVKPELVTGKNGMGLKSSDKNMFVNAGKLDLYRKPFTLAAWVNIESLDKSRAMFFGGQAPMGADVDVNGTALAAGIDNEKLIFSFQGADLNSNKKVTLGEWVHYAFTYNPEKEIGAIYVNGKVEKTDKQKPYAGPLDMIAGAQRFFHGKYVIDDILVTGSALEANAIKEIAEKGVGAMQKGGVTTAWRPLKTNLTNLNYKAQIPAGSNIQLIVETADTDGKTTGSKTFELKSGAQSISLEGLSAGSQVRVKAQLSTQKWVALPILETVVLSGAQKEAQVRWSTTAEWKQGSVSPGIKVGM